MDLSLLERVARRVTEADLSGGEAVLFDSSDNKVFGSPLLPLESVLEDVAFPRLRSVKLTTGSVLSRGSRLSTPLPTRVDSLFASKLGFSDPAPLLGSDLLSLALNADAVHKAKRIPLEHVVRGGAKMRRVDLTPVSSPDLDHRLVSKAWSEAASKPLTHVECESGFPLPLLSDAWSPPQPKCVGMDPEEARMEGLDRANVANVGEPLPAEEYHLAESQKNVL